MSDKPKSATVIDPASVPGKVGSIYPEPFAGAVRDRERRRLGDVAGLTNFGVNLVRLPPGSMSAQRHWHHLQDEFIWVVEGELVLVTEAGETTLGPGMAAGFPKGVADGHHLINRSDRDALYLEVGDRTPGDGAEYPDIDLRAISRDGSYVFTHKDGTDYD